MKNIKNEKYVKRDNEECTCVVEPSIISYTKRLATLSDGYNYIIMDMKHGCKTKQPYLEAQCAMGEKVSRIRYEINYCPICGRKL